MPTREGSAAKSNSGFQLKDLITSIIASVALAVSLFALYQTNLKPFTLELTVGDPMWVVENVDKDKRHVSLAIVANLMLTNTGALEGSVNDIALEIEQLPTKRNWPLRPDDFLNAEKLLRAIEEGKPIYTSSEGPFAEIFLSGRQQITKTILFRHPRFDISGLSAGKYRLHWHTGHLLTGTWRYWGCRTYEIPQSNEGPLLKGEPVTMESVELRTFRSQLKFSPTTQVVTAHPGDC